MEAKEKFDEGITLVALVITIIVLLILAGISLATLTGKNSFFARAKEAKEKTQMADAKETMNLKISEAYTNSYADGKEMTLNYLQTFLQADTKQVAYAETESQKTTNTENTQIVIEKLYVKLVKYPYEFEINDKIEIVRIDGVDASTIDTPSGTDSEKPGNSEEIIGEETASTIITSVNFASVSSNNSISLNITTESTDTSKIIGYHVFCVNNNTKEIKTVVSENPNCSINGLNKKTSYNIYVLAYDINNQYSKSSVKTIQTLNDSEKLNPVLTSNTSGGGNAFATYTANSTVPWYAFDGQIPVEAYGSVAGYVVSATTSNQIGYDFGDNNSKMVTKFVYYGHPSDANARFTSITLQYSDDGSTWNDVQSFTPIAITTYNTVSDLRQEFEITETVSNHRYWRIDGTNANHSWSGLLELEFWGY